MRRPVPVALLSLPLLALLAGACTSGAEPQAVRGTITASVIEEATPRPAPTRSRTPASPSPTAVASREPTVADRARFVASYSPPGATQLRDVAVDIDGDGRAEVLFAYLDSAEGRTRVAVAAWDGFRYGIAVEVVGGPADDLDAVRVSDLNGVGGREVAVFQSVGASGESVSLWSGMPDGQLAPLTAVGGCFAGSHTYGDTGVSVSDDDGDGAAEVSATCEDADLPQPLWPSDVYDWSEGAYRCEYREYADGSTAPCDTPRPAPTSTEDRG